MILAALTIALSQLRGPGFPSRLFSLLGYFAAGLVASVFGLDFFRGAFDPPPIYDETTVTEDINVWGLMQKMGVRFIVPYMTAFFLATASAELVRLMLRFSRGRTDETSVGNRYYGD